MKGKAASRKRRSTRATKNKKFIEEQIGKTVDALTRDRLYSLYGQEVEREMMARNREQFGFRVIDFPASRTGKPAPSGVGPWPPRPSCPSSWLAHFSRTGSAARKHRPPPRLLDRNRHRIFQVVP